MPFFIPVSIKVAIGIGAITGATIAVISNKEKVLETTELILQKGVDYCREKLEETKRVKQHFADYHEDNSFAASSRSTGISTPFHIDSDTDNATTPNASDFEDFEDELDVESLD